MDKISASFLFYHLTEKSWFFSFFFLFTGIIKNHLYKKAKQQQKTEGRGKKTEVGSEKRQFWTWGSGCNRTLACWPGKWERYDFWALDCSDPYYLPGKSCSGCEAVQALATTECFIAVWKCLFSEHKFRGQIQGMSRNKAYHHVSRADKDNLLYLAFVLSQ